MTPGHVPAHWLSRPGTWVHFVGIGGSGMRSAAQVLLDRGCRLSGSDQTLLGLAPLARRGVKLLADDEPFDPTGCDAVVYSPAIAAAHRARVAADGAGVRTLSYPQLLAELLRDKHGVAVAGTHGKSTTVAMAAEILTTAGLDPTVVYGAAPVGGFGGGRDGRGPIAIVEACEYRESFLALRPQVGVLLGIEHDHVDYYQTLAQLESAFARFAESVSSDGVLIVNADCRRSLAAAAQNDRLRQVTFGISSDADWQAARISHERGRYRFRLRCHGHEVAEITLRVGGRYNVSNALAAAVVASECGAPVEAIAAALAEYRGLQRRLERRQAKSGAVWIDDYAHHPTAVAATLAAVREMEPGRRLTVIFQPHQQSRTAHFLREFATSLGAADRVGITDIFRAREPSGYAGDQTAADLADCVRQTGVELLAGHTAEAILDGLDQLLTERDVVVTIGAGDLGKIYDERGEWFREDRADG